MGNGKRGTRAEGPFESPTPLAGHMPAKSPRDQGDFGPSGKRGSHDDGGKEGPLQRPRELRPGIDDGGTSSFNATKGEIIAGKHDTRRSHS